MFRTNFSGHYIGPHFERFQPASARFYSRHCYFRRDAAESQMTRLSRSLKLLISAICMQYTHRIDFPIGRNQSIICKSFKKGIIRIQDNMNEIIFQSSSFLFFEAGIPGGGNAPPDRSRGGHCPCCPPLWPPLIVSMIIEPTQ